MSDDGTSGPSLRPIGEPTSSQLFQVSGTDGDYHNEYVETYTNGTTKKYIESTALNLYIPANSNFDGFYDRTRIKLTK